MFSMKFLLFWRTILQVNARQRLLTFSVKYVIVYYAQIPG